MITSYLFKYSILHTVCVNSSVLEPVVLLRVMQHEDEHLRFSSNLAPVPNWQNVYAVCAAQKTLYLAPKLCLTVAGLSSHHVIAI